VFAETFLSAINFYSSRNAPQQNVGCVRGNFFVNN